ncbi:hypothetical protein GmHk_10G028460 [Glycine max]|nr:hypothetical protein GmHk_10G028460 [Glycine max]
MVAQVMLRHGYEPRMGLGKDSHGNANVVDIRGNPHKYGLGYEPGKPGRRNAPSRLRADRAWPGHVSQCFTSVGIMFEEEVAAIGGEAPQDPSSFEMALKKLSMRRSRRDAATEGSSAAPEFDSHRFRSAEHQQRFEAIRGWSFHKERRIQLREDEYTDFHEEIARRHWTSLVTPMAKFNPEVVLEFYANAWPTEEGVRDMRSWVRGQWIPFDTDALSQFLGDPLVVKEGQQCEFSQRRNRANRFDEEAIAQLLCTLGHDFARTAAGRRVRIMCTSMTTLTQTWMTLLLSNVLPSNHNSDLPLPKCQLVYAILTRMSVHMAQVIADAIYFFVSMSPTRHPLDPDKSNRALGSPALITGLCQQAEGDAPQGAGAPPPPHQVGPAGSLGMECCLPHLVCQQAANHRGQVQIHECLYRFSRSQQGQSSTPFVCPTPEQFAAEVAWPGDWPDAKAGEEPAGSPGRIDEPRMDEDMTDLFDFLGGSGAT